MVIGLWLVLVLACGGSASRSNNKQLTPTQRTEAQAGKDKACGTVSRLTNAGGFTKIEAGYSGVTHAYAGRESFSIPIDAKETALKAVALCYVDLNKRDQMGIVILHNGYSGKQIGTYDFASGLRMD